MNILRYIRFLFLPHQNISIYWAMVLILCCYLYDGYQYFICKDFLPHGNFGILSGGALWTLVFVCVILLPSNNNINIYTIYSLYIFEPSFVCFNSDFDYACTTLLWMEKKTHETCIRILSFFIYEILAFYNRIVFVFPQSKVGGFIGVDIVVAWICANLCNIYLCYSYIYI